MFEGFQSQGESINKDPGDVKWMYRARAVFQRQESHEEDTSGLSLEKHTDDYHRGKKPWQVSEVTGYGLFKESNQQWPV